MIHPWHDLQPGGSPPEHVTAVVELPSGSRNKYELDKASGLFRLDRVLYSAVSYPGEYGMLPRTLYEEYYDIASFPQHYLKEIEHFFLIYKDLEGRRVEIQGWERSDSAKQVIQESIARYDQKYMHVGQFESIPVPDAPTVRSPAPPRPWRWTCFTRSLIFLAPQLSPGTSVMRS